MRKMKHSIKQGIKRIAAFGMSFFMAFMPLSGIVPGAMAETTTTGNIKIKYDENVIDGSSFQWYNNEGIPTTDSAITAGGQYQLFAKALDSTNYNVKFTTNETVPKVGTIGNDAQEIDVTTEMLNATPAITLQAVTNADKEVTVTFADADTDATGAGATLTGATVNGTVATIDTDNGKVTIPTGSLSTDTVVISFQTSGIGTTVTYTGNGLAYSRMTATGERQYTLTTDVNTLVTSPTVTMELEPATDKISVTKTHTRITADPAYYYDEATDTLYKPDGGTTFSLTVTPETNYELSELKKNGTPMTLADTDKSGKAITVDNTVTSIEVTSVLKAPDAPNGSYTIADWYKKGTAANIDFTILTANAKDAVWKVQYGIGTSESTPPTSWTEVAGTAVTEGTRYTLEVASADSAQYLFVRYKHETEDVASDSLYLGAVKFDGAVPTVTSTSLVIDGVTQSGLTGIINKNQNDNGSVAIQIAASDNDESGIEKFEYSTDDGSTWNNASETTNGSGIYQIPYSLNNKCDTLCYRVLDKVGNVTSTASGELELDLTGIRFDLTAPTATYSFKQGDATVEDISKWQTGNITLTVIPTDPEGAVTGEMTPGSGIDSVDPVVVMDGDTNLTVTPDGAGGYGCTITGDGIHTLDITVRDMAGNEFNDTKTVMIDAAGVRNPQVTFGSEQTAFYEAVQMSADAESRAGIKTITFEFKNTDGTVVQSKTFQDVTGNQAEFTYTEEMGNFDGTVKVTFTDVCGREASCEKAFSFNKDGATIRITTNETWSNQDVAVSVDVTDDYTGITSVQFYVDGTLVASQNPTTENHHTGSLTVSDTSASVSGTQIEVVVTSKSGKKTHGYATVKIDKQAPGITLGGITDGAIYNVNKALQVTIEENIWQEMKLVEITAEKTLDGTTTQMDLGSFEAGSSVAATSRTITEDGVYTVTVVAEDAAGNRTSKSVSFTVDKTAPVVSMTGATVNTYSSNPVTIQFQVVESFFETNNVKITVERKLEGSTYTRTLTFNSTGKVSNLANTFAEDGDYTITITATDWAGNVAQTQTLSFTVDCTAPVITLTGTKDYLVTNQSITLNFVVLESYFETNKVQLQGSRRTPDGKTENITIPGWTNSARASSLSQAFSKDGYYTITITATDKAGNSKQQTIHFTIDTEPPVIGDLSKYDGKYLSYFQLEEDLEDLISELTVPTVKMTLNGETYNGEKITEDGKYTLVIEVVDEVGLTASKTVEFVIDNTQPKIIFAGAENKKTYTEAVNLNISLENENDTILEILINGEAYSLTEGQTSYNLAFDTFGTYEVEVHTIDAAGNENTQSIKFTYAEHKNQTLLWVVIGAGVAALGLGIFLVVRLRIKK